MIFDSTEAAVNSLVQWLRLGVEATGAVVVALGFLIALVRFVRESLKETGADFTAVRLVLARYLALALEFHLGADILSTAIAPNWTEIGKLGLIAVIRTGLNYFLSLEMKEEQATRKAEQKVVTAA